MTAHLIKYEAACRALAAAKAVDEVKDILDYAVAMKAYAKQAKNRHLEADAVEIRMRATRRLDQLRQAQSKTVGLNRGAVGGGKKNGPRGVLITPRDLRPTLDSQGIDKNLAKQARVLGAMDDAAFERKVEEARGSMSRVFRRAVREAEIAQERQERRARTASGGSVADLHALIASGYRAGAIMADPAWPFETHSVRSARAVFEHYETMPLDQIKALPIAALAAPDSALLLWGTWPLMPVWNDVIRAWKFEFKTVGLLWVKTTPSAPCIGLDGEGLHWGGGYHSRSNTEPCLLATRGSPLRLSTDVHQVVVAPIGEHSAKPEEVARRIERLYGGPYLELFARRPREGWRTWGNELPESRGSGR